MQIIISCSKTMGRTPGNCPAPTRPRFEKEAEEAVRDLLALRPDVLRTELGVNARIAAENILRYEAFLSGEAPETPALLAYTGVVFRYLRPGDFTPDDFRYACDHLFITSFLYGLLRPSDLVRPYRLEGHVRLPDRDYPTRFEFWRPLLTDLLIDTVKADDGVLLNLASAEMKRLFDWRRVEKEVRVVTPEFRLVEGDGTRTVVIYSKILRGLMTRFVLKNRPVSVEELSAFEPAIDEERAFEVAIRG